MSSKLFSKRVESNPTDLFKTKRFLGVFSFKIPGGDSVVFLKQNRAFIERPFVWGSLEEKRVFTVATLLGILYLFYS